MMQAERARGLPMFASTGANRAGGFRARRSSNTAPKGQNASTMNPRIGKGSAQRTLTAASAGGDDYGPRALQRRGVQEGGQQQPGASTGQAQQHGGAQEQTQVFGRRKGSKGRRGSSASGKGDQNGQGSRADSKQMGRACSKLKPNPKSTCERPVTVEQETQWDGRESEDSGHKLMQQKEHRKSRSVLDIQEAGRDIVVRSGEARPNLRKGKGVINISNQQFQVNRIEASYLSAGNQADTGEQSSQSRDRSQMETIPTREARSGFAGAVEADSAETPSNVRTIRQRKSDPRRNASAKPGVDPELLKFYKAFQNNQKISRPPIRLAGMDFQGDFVKLQKAVEEVGQTLERAEVELEQKAMQQVCEAAAGLDAAEAQEPPEQKCLHSIELLNLRQEASGATSGVRSNNLSPTMADMNIVPHYLGLNQPAALEQKRKEQIRLSQCLAAAPAEGRQELPAGQRYPVASASRLGIHPPAAATSEVDQAVSGASLSSPKVGKGWPRNARMYSASGEDGRFAPFALSQGAVTITKLEQEVHEELDSPLTPILAARGTTEPKLQQLPASPGRVRHSIKTLAKAAPKEPEQFGHHQAGVQNIRVIAGYNHVAPATSSENRMGQHQHMVISEQQSRMMESLSQRTTGILGSEAPGTSGSAGGVPQGRLNRPLLASKALFSATLQRQAVERLIEAENRKVQTALLESMASVPAANNKYDIQGQQPAIISDKEQMIFDILLNSQLGSRLGQVATANVDLLQSGEILKILDQSKNQSARIPSYVFDKFPEAVRDAIVQAANQERLQERPQSSGFYSRVKQGAHQVLSKRCQTQTNTSERKAQQIQLLTQKWQIQKPLQVTVQLTRAPPDQSKQRQQTRNAKNKTAQRFEAAPSGLRDLVQEEGQPGSLPNAARRHAHKKLEVDITKAQAATGHGQGLSRSPRTFDALSPQSLMLVGQVSQHGVGSPAGCIDHKHLQPASGMELASKGTLGITGKSYDPGLKATKLQSFFSADNINNDRFADADPGQPQLQLLSQNSNVASQTINGPGQAAQPQLPATLPGHHNFNASAKSMVTMHSDPDGTKFLHKGMYHHQNSRELKEGESLHNAALASSLRFPIQFGEENLKMMHLTEGQEDGVVWNSSKKVLEVDEDKEVGASRQGAVSSLAGAEDAEEAASPTALMRTALVVDAGSLDGRRDDVENEAEDTALRTDGLASQSDRKEEEKLSNRDLVLVQLDVGADPHAQASGGASPEKKPNIQPFLNEEQEDSAKTHSSKPKAPPQQPSTEQMVAVLNSRLSHASGRNAMAAEKPSKLDKIVYSAAPSTRDDKDEKPSTNDSKEPVSQLGQRLPPNAALRGARGEIAAPRYATKQFERSRSNRQARSNQMQRQVIQGHQGCNPDLLVAHKAPAASGDESVTTNINQSAMQQRYAILQQQINQYSSAKPHGQPMLNKATSAFPGTVFSGRRELPGNHRQTHRLNLEFEGSEMNHNVNSSFVMRSGSDKNELLRLLGTKSKNSGHKNSCMKNQKYKTKNSAPKTAEKKLEATWLQAECCSNENEEEELHKPHWGNNKHQHHKDEESNGHKKATLHRGSGATPSKIQGAALKQQLLQKTRTSESVNQRDMLKHLLSGVALPDRSIPDDCQEVHLDETALTSHLTDADSLIDANIGAAPASIMSANLKKNFLPTDPYNQVHNLSRTLMQINDQTKSNNQSGFFGHGFGRRRTARPKSSTNNDYSAYTRFIPELQNPKLDQTVLDSTPSSPARHKTMEAPPFIEGVQQLAVAHKHLEQPATMPRSNFSSEQQVNSQGASNWHQSRGREPRMPAHLQFLHSQQMISSKLSERLRAAGGSGYMLAQQMKGVVRFNSKDLSRIRLYQKQQRRPKPELKINTYCGSGQDYHTVNVKSSKSRYSKPNSAQQEPSRLTQET